MIEETKISESESKLVKDFSDLFVFQKSYSVSLEIHKFTLNLPKIEQYALADQVRRASKSICANVAEGFIRQQSSDIEFKRFILIALGSATEMIVWIRYALDLGYINQTIADSWVVEYQKISKMLQNLRVKR